MSRLDTILIGIIVIATVIVGAAYLNLTKTTPSAKTAQTQQKQAAGKRAPIQQAPIDFNDAAVADANIQYNLKGTITDIKSDPAGLTITTDIKAENRPGIVLTPKTQVFFKTGDKTAPAASTDLKKAQQIIVVVSYNTTLKKWLPVEAVLIVIPTAPASATPSATPK